MVHRHMGDTNARVAWRTLIWDMLPDETVREAIIGSRKWLNAYVSAGGAHFELLIS